MRILVAFYRATDCSSSFSSPFVSQGTSDTVLREFRAQDTRPDLGKGGITARGSIIAERRESAVVGSTEMLDRYVLRRLEYTVPHFFRSLNIGVSWSSDSHENSLIRFPVFAYGLQSVAAVPLTRQCDVEISRLQFKQAGQQLRIVNIRAVRRIEIIPRAGMHPNAPPLFWREP